MAGMVSPAIAHADVRSSPTGPPIYIKATELNLEDRGSKWHGRYGAGIALVPEFAGANSHNLDLDLDLKLFWKNTFFIENGTMGAIAFNNRIWRAGVLLRGVQGRRVRNLPEPIKGLGKVDARLDGGIFVGMSLYKTYLTAEFFTDLSGVTNGETFNLETGYTRELSRKMRLVPFIRMKWGSGQHLQKFFGVNTAQSLATGLDPYNAKMSLYESIAGLLFENDLGKNWRLGASMNMGILHGAAGNSPITRSQYGSHGQFTTRIKLLKTF
jgi:MipA family protein